MCRNTKLCYILIVIILLIIAELIFAEPHVYSPWHLFRGFDAIFGFVSSVVLILISKPLLDKLIKRSPDYYESAERNQEEKDHE